MAAPEFTFDPVAGRYRGPGGRFVPATRIQEAVSVVVDASAQRMRGLAEQLRGGDLAVAEWQQRMITEVRQIHVATASAARGGFAQMSQADLGWTGQRLRTQYGYLQRMAEQIADGRQPLNGSITTRAQLYARAATNTFGEMQRRDRRLAGAVEEKWQPSASESCSGCETQAARGWVTAGQLPPLGSQLCRSNCRCVIVSRKQEVAA